jgi:hypothetical protein
MVVRGVRGVGNDQLADEAIIRYIPIHFDSLSKQFLFNYLMLVETVF